MSACISREGEYSDHTPDKDYYCTRCYVLDEPALLDRVRELEAVNAKHVADLQDWEVTGAPMWIERRDRQLSEVRAERDAALAVIAKVWEMHVQVGPDSGFCRYCQRYGGTWPCPTVQALGSVPSTGEGN